MARKRRYYDPEYDRIVGEDVPKKQYEWFRTHYSWFNKSYEQFLADNFLNADMTAIERDGGFACEADIN